MPLLLSASVSGLVVAGWLPDKTGVVVPLGAPEAASTALLAAAGLSRERLNPDRPPVMPERSTEARLEGGAVGADPPADALRVAAAADGMGSLHPGRPLRTSYSCARSAIELSMRRNLSSAASSSSSSSTSSIATSAMSMDVPLRFSFNPYSELSAWRLPSAGAVVLGLLFLRLPQLPHWIATMTSSVHSTWPLTAADTHLPSRCTSLPRYMSLPVAVRTPILKGKPMSMATRTLGPLNRSTLSTPPSLLPPPMWSWAGISTLFLREPSPRLV
mmetsp:Transcript_28067/g.71528  ORF Transcript_28067/g.71528 Transcript_28067/m.71528 type:complete len:273 (+) Transcript_28067:372-1190(+)